MKNKENLVFGEIVQTTDPRIIRTSNNSLIIYNVTKNDSSDHYICQVLSQPNPIEVVHRIHVVNKPKENWGDSHSIRVFPGKRLEVNETEKLSFGCETRLQPQPQIKWSHKVSLYIN